MSLEQKLDLLTAEITKLIGVLGGAKISTQASADTTAAAAKTGKATAPAKGKANGKTPPPTDDLDDGLGLDDDLDTPADDLDDGLGLDDDSLEEEVEEVTREAVLAVLKAISIKPKGREAVADILKKAAKVTEFAKVKPEHYAAVLAEAKKVK